MPGEQKSQIRPVFRTAVEVLAEVGRGGTAARVTKTIREAVRKTKSLPRSGREATPGMAALPEGVSSLCGIVAKDCNIETASVQGKASSRCQGNPAGRPWSADL